jgi:GTP diphosphokinase / guanosine-3',5'-bis(diphosphate) 3'-diphosphatase
MKYEERLDDHLDRFSPEDREKIAQAEAWARELHAGELRASGEPAYTHLERVAALLASMGMDADSVVSGLLHHTLEDGKAGAAAKAEIDKRFGPRVAGLVEELARMASLKAKNKTIQAAETIRKMLFAMTKDLRVIIVKLADKLDNMRTLKWLAEEDRKRIAAECLDVFAPLADRLGISWLKDELEDLALKEINREAFDQIKRIVAGKKDERQAFLAQASADIVSAAAEEGFAVDVSARAKHFYSIYQKMRKRGKGAEELYDLSGLRLLCDGESECYALVGIVHRLWKPLEGRFKDYIAMPKANGYRSLHTTVLAEDGTLLEIQIRTRAMHQIAEYGIASHWLYKKGSSHELVRPEDLSLINRLKDWSAILESGDEFLEDIKRELLKDSIFVFTPRGDAIELPAGSTPLDFAYAIHSDVGNRTIAAKADGSIVPLDSRLKNTQVVEIQTSATARPNVNWLKAVKTSKARGKIRQWLVNEGQVLAIDKNVVARKRDEGEGRKDKGDDKAKPPEPRLEPDLRRHEHEADSGSVVDFRPYKPNEATDSHKAGLSVVGAGSLMVRFAGCCKPSVGDRIVGYVSRGRGIIVHKAGCKNLPGISEFAERRVEVSWEASQGLIRHYRVWSKKSADLFSEIENAAKKNGGRLTEGRLEVERDGLTGSFTMAFASPEDARVVERNLRNVPSIQKIRRVE